MIMLWCLSIMWQVRITIVYTGPQPYQVRIRHDAPLVEVDMVILYNGANHFCSAGKSHAWRIVE